MEKMEAARSPEEHEYGRDVEIVLKFIRHGERDTALRLTDYGREITKKKAQESGLSDEDFDAVKAIGSNASPLNSEGMGRSLETASIFAHEIAGDEALQARKNPALNYENIISPSPHNHTEVYNSFLPKNYSALGNEEKSEAAKRAQEKTLNHLFSLKTPEAEQYLKEIAGSHAYVIDHYVQMTRKLKNGSRVLIPAGGHGGSMEPLLKYAMVREENGKREVGFKELEEIGGAFDPSESFDVDIAKDGGGELKQLKLIFNDPKRPHGELEIDYPTVVALKDFYLALHKEKE